MRLWYCDASFDWKKIGFETTQMNFSKIPTWTQTSFCSSVVLAVALVDDYVLVSETGNETWNESEMTIFPLVHGFFALVELVTF